MKDKYIRIRTSERRLKKLHINAASKEKTMTQIIEDFIDSLPSKRLGDSVPFGLRRERPRPELAEGSVER
jgi:hypothetical protein